MSAIFALLAAFSNALNVVTQHVASTAAPPRDTGWRLALYLARNPLWLFGVGATLAGFVFQAAALYEGSLSVVQALLVTELVFSLVIGYTWLHREVSAAAWASACLTSGGLALFLVMAEPHGGHPKPSPGAWLPAMALTAAIVGLMTAAAHGGSPSRKGACYAAAAGIAWATVATLVKAGTAVLAATGALSLLWHGVTYGVVAGGLLATVLTQAALHNGPLAVSQPLMVGVDPSYSVVLAVWLYGEHFTQEPLKVALGAAGFVAMVVGVVFLSRTAPPFEATSRPEPVGSAR